MGGRAKFPCTLHASAIFFFLHEYIERGSSFLIPAAVPLAMMYACRYVRAEAQLARHEKKKTHPLACDLLLAISCMLLRVCTYIHTGPPKNNCKKSVALYGQCKYGRKLASL